MRDFAHRFGRVRIERDRAAPLGDQLLVFTSDAVLAEELSRGKQLAPLLAERVWPNCFRIRQLDRVAAAFLAREVGAGKNLLLSHRRLDRRLQEREPDVAQARMAGIADFSRSVRVGWVESAAGPAARRASRQKCFMSPCYRTMVTLSRAGGPCYPVPRFEAIFR